MKNFFRLALVYTLGFFISPEITAQQNELLFNPDLKTSGLAGKASSWDLQVNSNAATLNAAITLLDKENVYHYLVDSSFKILKQYSFLRMELPNDFFNSNKYEVILESSSNNTFRKYITKENSNEIFCEELDFAGERSKFYHAFAFGDKEDLIKAFEMNDKIYLITLPNKSNRLRFYTIGEKEFKEVELATKDAPDFDVANALKNVEPIETDEHVTLLRAKQKAKLYINTADRYVTLTFDNNWRYTAVFKIDLRSFEITSRRFISNPGLCNKVINPDVIQTNSYVVGGKLIQGLFCPENYSLQIKSLVSDSTLQQFRAGRGADISFASSELTKVEEHKKIKAGLLMLTGMPMRNGVYMDRKSNENSSSKSELSTKEFFRAINKSTLALTAVKHENFIIIKTGEVHNLFTTTGGGGGFSAVGGMAGAPMFIHRAGGRVKSGQAETYFTTVLNSGDLNFIPGVEPETKFDKLESLESALPQAELAEASFNFNGKSYLMQWRKNKMQFSIHEIK